MKTTTFVSAGFLLIINLANAQKLKEAEVPKVVLSAFSENFKGINAKSWEKEKNNYEAEFDRNKTETSATFSADGALIETETEIEISALPVKVNDYLMSHYPTFKLMEASRIIAPCGAISFEAEIEKGKEKIDLIFNDSGNFVSKEVKNHKNKNQD